MGAKQTKLDGEEYFLPAAPQLKLIKPHNYSEFLDADHLTDPRSPSGTRTPIKIFHTASQEKREAADVEAHPLGLLRKRFLKGFTYSLNDPRSPGVVFNRTPLVFEGEKTLNLDDTFADLFVESRAASEVEKTMPTETQTPKALDEELKEVSKKREESLEEMHMDAAFITAPNIGAENDEESFCFSSPHSSSIFSSFVVDEEETMPCPALLLQQTPPMSAFQAQKPLDPRSPTFGVERTPIIFSDDDEGVEDQLLESILATLSLQLNASNASSDFSFGTPTAELVLAEDDGKEQEEARLSSVTNKPLERVRLGVRKPLRKRHAYRPHIYEDRENAGGAALGTPSPTAKTTPPHRQLQQQNSAGKRTPLSCVKNRSQLRSRSVDASAVKSHKSRLLQPTSFGGGDAASKRSKLRTLKSDSHEQLELL